MGVETEDTEATFVPEAVARSGDSALAAVERLLQGDENPPSSDEAPEKVATEQAQKPKLDIKSVAERLQVTPEELYGLTFKTGDGEELTVGEIKDRVKKAQDLEKSETEYIHARGEFEADRIRAQRELDAILASIEPQNVKPELMAERKRQFDDYVSRETEATLRRIPEWADPTVKTADLARIEKAVSKYGFTRAELDNAVDHRLRRLLRDHANLIDEVDKLKKPPPVKVAAAPKRPATQTPNQQFGRIKAAVTSGRLSKVAAVEQLLRSR